MIAAIAGAIALCDQSGHTGKGFTVRSGPLFLPGLSQFLFVTVSASAFFTLVRIDFVALTFPTAGH